MKTPRNRKKAFRVDCVNCHCTQDSLRIACNQCHRALYSNMEEQEMQLITEKVEAMETALTLIEAPAADKATPYQPIDNAWDAYKALKGYTFLPGMTAYLDRVLEVLLPIKVRLMERTLKANWAFLFVLAAFPIITLLFKLHWSISILLLLPAAVWLLVTLKAAKDLQRTRDRMTQIQST